MENIVEIARKNKRLTQSQLGKLIGLSQSQTSKLCSGSTKVLKFETAQKLKEHLGISLDEMFSVK